MGQDRMAKDGTDMPNAMCHSLHNNEALKNPPNNNNTFPGTDFSKCQKKTKKNIETNAQSQFKWTILVWIYMDPIRLRLYVCTGLT